MQVAMLLNHLGSRAQPEVKGIAENNLRADRFYIARQHALDGAIGAYGHKGRGLYHTTRKGQASATGLAIGGQQFKGHVTHGVTSGPRAAGLRVINMASP